MPKFSLDINGVGAGAAEGREAWSGELPKTGTYEGRLRVISIGTIGSGAQNAGKPKLSIGVELVNTANGIYDGYMAWGNLSLIDQSIPFVNQFLWCLTNGSQAEKDAIEKAFYGNGIVVDERKKHIIKIGKFQIDSPKADIPIRISLSNRNFYNEANKSTTESVRIESYLPLAGGAKANSRNVEAAPEDESYEDEGYDDNEDVETYDDDSELLDAD